MLFLQKNWDRLNNWLRPNLMGTKGKTGGTATSEALNADDAIIQ